MSSYLTRLLEAYRAGQIEAGSMTRAEVAHEPHCPAIEGGACGCECSLTITGSAAAEGAGSPGQQGDTT